MSNCLVEVADDAGTRIDTDKPVADSTSPASPSGPQPDEEAGKTKRRACIQVFSRHHACYGDGKQ